MSSARRWPTNRCRFASCSSSCFSRLKQELEQEAKRQRLVGHRLAEDIRYGEPSTAQRVNGGLKDNHGGRTVRVRGGAKVMCHLMFGVLSFTALQLLRLVT